MTQSTCHLALPDARHQVVCDNARTAVITTSTAATNKHRLVVIGAGLPGTGTRNLAVALQRLYGRPVLLGASSFPKMHSLSAPTSVDASQKPLSLFPLLLPLSLACLLKIKMQNTGVLLSLSDFFRVVVNWLLRPIVSNKMQKKVNKEYGCCGESVGCSNDNGVRSGRMQTQITEELNKVLRLMSLNHGDNGNNSNDSNNGNHGNNGNYGNTGNNGNNSNDGNNSNHGNNNNNDIYSDGYVAVLDLPSCLVYRQLMRLYPEAKVILTLRDPDTWLQVCRSILNPPSFLSPPLPPSSLYSAAATSSTAVCATTKIASTNTTFMALKQLTLKYLLLIWQLVTIRRTEIIELVHRWHWQWQWRWRYIQMKQSQGYLNKCKKQEQQKNLLLKALGLNLIVTPKGAALSDSLLRRAFIEWNIRVERSVPCHRLLVFHPSQGYPPLCAFLGLPLPPTPRQLFLPDSLKLFPISSTASTFDVVSETAFLFNSEQQYNRENNKIKIFKEWEKKTHAKNEEVKQNEKCKWTEWLDEEEKERKSIYEENIETDYWLSCAKRAVIVGMIAGALVFWQICVNC